MLTPDELLDRVANNPGDPIAASAVHQWIASDPPIPHMLAFAERCIGELALAKPVLDEVLVREPKNDDAWALLALGHYLSAEYAPARDAADHALAINPVNERALDVQLSLLDPQQMPTAALTIAERMFEAHPMNLRALSYLAKARHLAGDAEGARDLIAKYQRTHAAFFLDKQRRQLDQLAIELQASDLSSEDTFSWP